MTTTNIVRAFVVVALCLRAGAATAQTSTLDPAIAQANAAIVAQEMTDFRAEQNRAAMRPVIVGVYASIAADAISTHVGLGRGAREVELPTQNRAVIDAVLAAEMIGIGRSLRVLSMQHPRLAKGLGVVLIGVRSAIVLNNVRVIRAQGGLR